MAKRFFVRVQLHEVEEGDQAYGTLHEGMEANKFERTIDVTDQGSRKLPHGCYIIGENVAKTKENAALLVEAAVRVTGRTSSFVVLEIDTGMTVNNLLPAEQPKSIAERVVEKFKKKG